MGFFQYLFHVHGMTSIGVSLESQLFLQMVTEFFGYAVNSILYQRGIYPPENFQGVQK